MPFQKRGPKGEETFYRIAPWFQDVIGPALVFTGHETASGPESERIADKLREIDAGPEPVTSTASHKASRPGARTTKATSKDGAHKGAGRDGTDHAIEGCPALRRRRRWNCQLRGWH